MNPPLNSPRSTNNPPQIVPISDDLYPELTQFKQELISAGATFFQPYDLYKKMAFFYRCVFLGFSALFAALMSLVFMQGIDWPIFLLGYSLLLKACLGGLSAIFSLVGLLVALSITPEKEATHQVWKKARYWIVQIYRHRRARFGWKRVFSHQMHQIRHAYHDALEKMHDAREKTSVILNHIASAVHLQQDQRAHLFNQAVLDLRDQLHTIITQYRANEG